MKTIRGDLISLALEGHFDVILHGCNCFCTMGAGIAKQIKSVFKQAYKVDLASGKNPKKLGKISVAEIEKPPLFVVNCYTQVGFGRGSVQVDYDAVRSCMNGVKDRFAGNRIGYPKIGAGLAGGDWNLIATIIDEVLIGEDHTLVEYVPS